VTQVQTVYRLSLTTATSPDELKMLGDIVQYIASLSDTIARPDGKKCIACISYQQFAGLRCAS
jgi:hypothetical protein